MSEMYCTQCGHDPLLQADNDRRNREELEAARARIAELEAERAGFDPDGLLPDDDIMVIAWDTERGAVPATHDSGWWWHAIERHPLDVVLRWWPMPELPTRPEASNA